MAFLEVEFPREISFGSSGGPGFNTSIVEGDSGYSERVSRWSTPRHRYNIRYGIRTVTQLNTVKDLYIRAGGTVHGFRYYDWLDHSTATDHVSAPGPFDVVIGTSTGTGTQAFQLKKKYTYGGLPNPVERTIRKPIAGTVRVAINGSEVTTGWTVDTTTGIVTITTGLTAGVEVTAGCEFNVPVQFGQEVDEVLAATIDNFNSGDLPDLPLVEMIGDVVSPERFYAGGATVITTAEDFSINHSLKKVIVYAANASKPVTAFLIDPSDLELGGPYFHVIYRPSGGANTLTLKSFDGSLTYATMGTSGNCSIFCVYQDAGVNKWVAFNNF